MKKLLFNLRALMLLLLMMVGVSSVLAEDATMAAGTNGSTATVNEKSAIKVGTSKAGGDMTITVPAGATSLEFYAAAWKGATGLSLNITPAANVSPTSVSLAVDDGIANNSPFTLYGTESSYKFTIALSNISEETTLTLASSTAKRFVVWGATYTSAKDTRTAVNMTGFSATSTTLVKGYNTTTSVTNDQNGWTPSYTYESSNTGVATVSNDGVITAVAKGTATITASLNIANDDATWKKGATASKTIDITVNNPSHTAKFSINGSIKEDDNKTVEEGDAIEFPTDPEVDGVVFKGWATAAIVGTQDAAPTMVNTATETMGISDVTYYAVFATEEKGGTEYKLVESLTNGKKYVFATRNTAGNGYALSSSVTAGTSVTIIESGSKKIVSGTPENTIIWTAATGWSLTNNGVDSNNKLAINGSTFAINGSGSSNLSWTTNFGLNGQSGKGSTKYYVQCTNTGTFSKSSTSGSTTNRVYAYEESVGVQYSDYCTTVSLDPQPTIVLSATELAEYVGNTNTTITASVSEDGYTGTLSVASSAEAVATASISEGTITIQAIAAGTATITVTAPKMTGFRQNTATIAVTVSEKLAHGLAFSADALNLTVGDTEFTEPTLSNPNSLPVVYSLVYATPANEGKVATINAETGKLTLADPSLSTETQGAVTVKASTIGDNSHAAGEVTYKLVVARKSSTTSWSNGGTAVTIDKDEIGTLPTASNDGGRNIAYESSNTDVATIDNTGAVTFVAYGTTTITAKTSATAEYAATSATYELTFAPRYTVTFIINGNETVRREETTGAGVTAPEVEPIAGKVFCGWADTEINGTTNDKPAFVFTESLDGDKTLYAVFANVTPGAEGSVDFDLTSIPNIGASAAERSQTTDGVTFTFSSVQQVNVSGTNYVQMAKSSTLIQNVAFAGNIKSITFEGFKYSSTKDGSMLVEGKKGADGIYATVQSCGSSYSGSEIDFSTNEYDFLKISIGSERTVMFTKMTINYSGVSYSDYCTTIQILASKPELQGWKTFYNPETSFEVDENTSIYIAQIESNEVLLTKVDGRIVDAGKPVLLKTTDDENYEIHLIETATASGVNWNGNAFGVTSNSNNTGYVLAAKKPAGSDEKVLAFWKYTNLPARMVYIPVASESASLRFSVVDEESTGIRTIEEDKNTQEILFNLTGLKVTENKGLMVRDGKVVLVK